MAERGETKYPQHHYVLKVAQGETRRRLWLIYLNIKTASSTKCKDLKLKGPLASALCVVEETCLVEWWDMNGGILC